MPKRKQPFQNQLNKAGLGSSLQTIQLKVESSSKLLNGYAFSKIAGILFKDRKVQEIIEDIASSITKYISCTVYYMLQKQLAYTLALQYWPGTLSFRYFKYELTMTLNSRR